MSRTVMAWLWFVCILISAGTCNEVNEPLRPPTGAESPEVELFAAATDVWKVQGNPLVYSDPGKHFQGTTEILKKSESGYRLAVGGYGNDAGKVYLFDSIDAKTWTQNTILFTKGYSVAMTDSPGEIAIGDPNSPTTGKGTIWHFVDGQDGFTLEEGFPMVTTGPSCGLSLATDYGSVIVAGCNGKALIYERGGPTNAYAFKQTLDQAPYAGGNFGYSVDISLFANTIAVTRPSGNGGVYVFYRSDADAATDGNWNVQGSQLIGVSVVGPITQDSVAINQDGNILIYGASTDNSNNGAAWVFSRKADLSGWVTGSAKIIPAVAKAHIGQKVAISDDGTLILIAAPADNANKGSVWVYRKSGGVWVKEQKIEGTGLNFGSAVDIVTREAEYLVIGESQRNSNVGASWIYKYFAPSPTPATTSKPTPKPTPKPLTPRFITYTNPGESIKKGTISATSTITFTFTNTTTPMFTVPKLLNGYPYRSGPATANVKLTSIQAKATVVLNINPGLANPLLIYCAQWPEGDYHFTPNTWTILSKGTQVSSIFTDPQNRKSLRVTDQFSGIISFPKGVSKVQWVGTPKVATAKLSFIVAKPR